MGRTNRIYRAAAALAATLLLGACTVHKQDTPSLTGPSALGTSLVLTVSPDQLQQDGASQSLVQISAFDSNGQPLRNVSMRVEISVDGAITDFGAISARNVVTDAAGHASVVYTAPPSPPPGSIFSDTVVQILVTPAASDFADATARRVNIRLTAPGVIGPGLSPLRPEFTVPAPTVGNATAFQATVLDANGADATGQVVSFAWTFGDGGSASGRNVTHTYNNPGSYLVSLTITDNLGRTQRVTHTVSTAQGQLPTAAFTTSPSSPGVHETINFNAAGSTAEPGHTITDYSWNFGDGSTGGGVTTTHSYGTAGSYTVTLQVTDDAGRKSTVASQTIPVGLNGPTASFTFSPTAPIVDQTINFNASQSKAQPGRVIASYSWDFGDGTSPGSGQNPTHKYSLPGTYTVTLTVTDNAGQTGFATQTIAVSNGNPQADFTFNPSAARAGQQVIFDGSASQAFGGRTIVSYSWAFGDGGSGSGQTVPHSFGVIGGVATTYNVLLTVTDSAGKTNSVTKSITINP